MRRCMDFHWECKFRDSAMYFRHLLWSGCECWAFKSRHDSATTATEIQASLGMRNVSIDEFGRSRILVEPCVRAGISREAVLEGVGES